MDNQEKEIRRLIKPKLITGFLLSLICIAPYINLIYKLIYSKYDKILTDAACSFFTLICLGAYWCWHIIKVINLDRDVEQIKKIMEE